MNYKDACKYLEGCYKSGSKKGHKNMEKLLELLGNPHRELKCIHIAGTNGKGSCCAFLSSALMEAGYNTAVFTSPHLIKYNERFRFNAENISDREFCEIIQQVRKAVDKLFNGSGEAFSFFEIITAAAFCWFKRKNADYVILEVGLGGRLDSTNVIEKPVLSVITSISLDHMQYLGNTIEEISKEKGGIIKKNCPVVLYCQGEKVYNVISGICRENNSPLFYEESYKEKIVEQDFNYTVFNAEILNKKYNNVKITMAGNYQVNNACNALMCIEVMRKNGIEISDKAVYRGFERAFISGRMELIKKDRPMVFLDGAHNEGGCCELYSYIKELKDRKKLKTALLMGVLKDKSFDKMVNKLCGAVDNIVLTQPDNPRALNSRELFDCLNEKEKCVFYDDDYKKAFDFAVSLKQIDVLFCCGSLYLIGDIKKYFEGDYA